MKDIIMKSLLVSLMGIWLGLTVANAWELGKLKIENDLYKKKLREAVLECYCGGK